MFGLNKNTKTVHNNRQAQRTGAGAMLRSMVRFCNFYGEYQVTPPSDRRQFVIEQETRQ